MDTGLPESLELAWGVRERPRKGPRGELSLERIVGAGVAVARADGIGAVSMARVAAELGASTMALYRYVRAKDELLELMADAAMGPPPAYDPDAGWRAGLSAWAWAEKAALEADPWWFDVPIRGLPKTPNQIAWLDAGLRCTAGTGLTGAERMSVMLLVTAYVQSLVNLTASVRAAYAAAGETPAEADRGFGRLLRLLTDADGFPGLHEILAEGVFDQADEEPDHDFRFGVERILDGVEALIRTRV